MFIMLQELYFILNKQRKEYISVENLCRFTFLQRNDKLLFFVKVSLF